MVATGLPIATAAPQASKAGQTESANAATGSPEGGFADALMQLLGLAEPAETPAPVANPLVHALLDAADEDSGNPADTDAAALLAMLPLMQPSELRTAQAAARQSGAAAPNAIAATGVSLEATVAAALAGADGAQELKTLLKEQGADAQSQAGDAPSQSLPSGALQLQETPNTARTPANDNAVSRPLQNHVGTPAWSDELGARMQLMAEKGHHLASLKLSPEHLGPLEVQISVQDDQATVWFGASNVDTRAALEQALPRLRELFAAQGMSLAHSGVFQQSPNAQGQSHQTPGLGRENGDISEASETTPIAHLRRGLLDAYA